MRGHIFVVLSHPVCGNLIQHSRKQMYNVCFLIVKVLINLYKIPYNLSRTSYGNDMVAFYKKIIFEKNCVYFFKL